jgi:putative membrane-bound dehydrogenase-like protein
VRAEINQHSFQFPAGLKLRLVAGESLIKWPISADVAADGSLFVTESSGSNAPVQQQLQELTHRVVRLIDQDGDGTYDQRQVFADKLMFPEGILCIDQGVLVAAPPQIWKLQDRDSDGVAEVREVWFDGKTLTGCANDLHGPYRGPDGLIYWCKGAFAEQTHELSDGSILKTTASHIFRRSVEGGKIESVMTGGMDNPVEVAFDRAGNIFFTSTFVQHPAGGRRDGLVHAVYGGVYGKDHGVIQSHPRTGDLMPIMTHLGPAAPSGLMSIKNNLLGLEFNGALVATHFNLQKITAHRLEPFQSGYITKDTDLLKSDRLDFHPTDVLHDLDGSLLVIDTGGWYRLCCPTSHLDQSAAAGGIYRLENAALSPRPAQKIEKQIQWDQLGYDELFRHLEEMRIGNVNQALAELERRGADALQPIREILARQGVSVETRQELLWLLGRSRQPRSLELVAETLSLPENRLRQTALQILGTHRSSLAKLRGISGSQVTDPIELRLSLQGLGRLWAVTNDLRIENVFNALAQLPNLSEDRLLEHALTYAVIESKNVELAKRLLKSPTNVPAYCKALHALEPQALEFATIFGLLTKKDGSLAEQAYARSTALWLISRSDGWDVEIAKQLDQVLAAGLESSEREMRSLLALCMNKPKLSPAMAEYLLSHKGDADIRSRILSHLVSLPAIDLSEKWLETLMQLGQEQETSADHVLILTMLRRNKIPENAREKLSSWLNSLLATSPDQRAPSTEILATFPAQSHTIVERELEELVRQLGSDQPVAQRGLAIEALRRGRLSNDQRDLLALQLESVGPMEISSLLSLLESDQRQQLTESIVASLLKNEVAQSIPMDRLIRHFAMHPVEQRDSALKKLAASIDSSLEQRKERLDSFMSQLKGGDPLRGLQVFHGSKASCGACHEIGYRGGNIGPDLSRVGSIRSRRDLLEAILYPSVSFVRSYEPVMVLTRDGEVVNGLLTEENAEGVTVIVAADQRRRIDAQEIEEIRPGKISVMPGGLEQVLTIQELSDLIALLESSR